MKKLVRKSTQAPRIVQAKIDNLPPDAPPEELGMLNWFIKKGKYPVWRYTVTKAIDAVVDVSGNVDVHARDARVLGAKVQSLDSPQTTTGLNLAEILSIENPENSYNYLTNLRPPPQHRPLPTLQEIKASFERNQYFLTEDDIFDIHQAITQGRALLISGPPGVGKTECAQQIALAMGLGPDNPNHYTKLFCTPDIGTEQAIFAWNDAKRLLDLQLLNGVIGSLGSRVSNEQVMLMYREIAANAYSLRYLEIRKLLRACIIPYRTVALIDEADKPYPTFDNELLDILAYYRYEIPEYGPIGRPAGTRPENPTNPFFVLTVNDSSSGGRDLSPMVVSRCTPLFLNYLPAALEQKVVQAKCQLDAHSAGLVAQFFYDVRTGSLKMRNPPSTREVIATSSALVASGLQPNVQNLLRLHCHWTKNRLDYEALRSKYVTRDANNKEVWRESL